MKGGKTACRSVHSETEPNRERPTPKGRGVLVLSTPRNQGAPAPWKLRRAGRLGRAARLEAQKASSDVTECMTRVANRGRTVASGVMPGARQGLVGISNAAVWESASSRTDRKVRGAEGEAPRRRWAFVQPWHGKAVVARLERSGGAEREMRNERSDGSLTRPGMTDEWSRGAPRAPRATVPGEGETWS